MDFADALHLAKAQGCEAFTSFDQCFAAVANTLSNVKVRAPQWMDGVAQHLVHRSREA